MNECEVALEIMLVLMLDVRAAPTAFFCLEHRFDRAQINLV
jgi:hypothetical protein